MKKFIKYLFAFLLVIPFAFIITACNSGSDSGSGGGSDPGTPSGPVAAHTINFWLNNQKVYSFGYDTEEEIWNMQIPENYSDPLYYISDWWVNTPDYSGSLNLWSDIDFMSFPKVVDAYGTVVSVFNVNQEGIINGMNYMYGGGENLTIPTHIKDNFVDCDVVGIESMTDGYSPVPFSSLTIPKEITYFGERAFDFKTNVEVNIEEGHEVLTISNNCVMEIATGEMLYANDGFVLPENLTTINANALAYKELPEDFVIPSSVTTIKENAFGGYSLENLVVPNTVKVIEEGAFKNSSNLKTVTFEENSQLEKLGSSVFIECSQLEQINIPFLSETNSIGEDSRLARLFDLGSWGVPYNVKKVTITNAVEVSDNAFANCGGLEEVCLPNTLEVIGDNIFSNSSCLKKVTTPTLKDCSEYIEEVVLTSTVDIKEKQFYEAENLKKIVIPEGVKKIGNEAFYYCSSLEDCELPSTITSIGDSAFYFTKITEIALTEAIETIGKNAFRSSRLLETVTIPNSITTVPEGIFSSCTNLKTVVLGNKTTSIGASAFRDCESLATINFPETLKTIGEDAFFFCFKLTNCDLSKTAITELGSSAFSRTRNVENIILPRTLQKISSSAFIGCDKVTSITIPNTITEIGSYAFAQCGELQTVTIEDGAHITSVGSYAFESCIKLENFNYTNKTTIEDFGYYTFEYCSSLTSFTFYGTDGFGILDHCKSIKNIEIDKFNNLHKLFGSASDLECIENLYITDEEAITSSGLYYLTNLKSLKISDKVKTIQYDGLSKIEDLTIEGGLTEIPANTFKGFTNLKSVELGASIITIGNNAFENCTNLTSVNLLGAETIGSYAFNNTGLESFTMYANLTNIGAYAFANSKIVNIVNNAKIQEIGDFAFYNCKIEEITLPSCLITLGDGVFAKNAIETVISENDNFVTDGSYLVEINTAANDKKIIIYTQDVDLQDVTAIGAYAFSNLDITSFVVPSGVNFIGNGAFENCENLKSFVFANLENTDVILGEYIFNNTPKLETLKMPILGSDKDTPKSYNNYFNYFNRETSNLKTVEIYSAKTLQNRVFEDCNNLTSFKVLQKDVEVVKDYAFCNLSKLATAELGSNIKEIGTNSFYNCSSLTNFDFGTKLESISDRAFEGTGLKEVIIPETTTLLGNRIFRNCLNLELLYVPKSVTTIKGSLIEGCLNTIYVYCAPGESQISSVHSKINWSSSWNELNSSQKATTRYYCYIYDEDNQKYIHSDTTAMRYMGTDSDVVIPEYFTALDETFKNRTDITSVKLHNKMTGIYNNAFYGCTGITSLYIPSVSTYDDGIIYNSGIENIFFGGETDNGKFGSTSTWNKISATKNANLYAGFSEEGYANRETLMAELETLRQSKPKFDFTLQSDGIAVAAYNGGTSDKIVTIPEGVTKICKEVFRDNTNITHINMSDSVKTIGSLAFYNCTNLQFVYLGSGLETIVCTTEHSPFTNCSSTALMVYTALSEQQTSIYHENWKDCVSGFDIPVVYGKTLGLARAHYSGLFTTIENLATENPKMGFALFHGHIAVVNSQKGIGTVYLPKEVTAIYNYAFKDSGISVIKLHDNVQYIGEGAFYGTSIKKIFIPKSVQKITGRIFDSNSKCVIRCELSQEEATKWHSYWNSRYPSGGRLEVLYSCYYLTDSKTGYEALCDSTSKILEYSGDHVNVKIPSGVKIVGDTFFDDDRIETLFIPNTVETIEKDAFYHCSNLKTVDFEEDCKINTLDETFIYCNSLEYFYIPESVTSLVGGVFESCNNLEFVYIPDSVEYISNTTNSVGHIFSPFDECDPDLRILIESSEIPDGWADKWYYLSSPNDRFYDKSIYLDCAKPNLGVDYILSNDGSTIKAFRLNRGKNLETPTNSSITTLGDYALYYLREDNSLDTFTITQNITQIGKAAFCFAEIPYLLLPETVTTFTATTEEEGAFYGYGGKIYASATEALDGWGEYWQNGNVYLGAYINEDGFGLANSGKTLVQYYGNDINLVIPDTVEEVVEFPKYDYITIKMPGCIKNICRLFFEGNTTLQSVEIGDGTLTVADYAFSGCTSLTNVSLPGTIESIGNYVFEGCTALKTVVFNEGIQTVGEYIFKTCTGLEYVYIPSTITSFGKYAFHGANSEAIVFSNNFLDTPSNWNGAWSYYSTKEHVKIYVGMTREDFDNMKELFALLETYNADEEYSDYTFSLQFSGLSIASYTGSATEVVIPEGVTAIESSAFYNNQTITSVTLPNSVVSIDDWAFAGCSALESINLNNVKYFDSNAFNGCSMLTDVNILSAKWLGSNIFKDTGITYLYLPQGVISYSNFYVPAKIEEAMVYAGFEEGDSGWPSWSFPEYCIKYGYTNEDAVEEYAGKIERLAILNATEGYEYSLYYGENMLKAYTGAETSITLPNDVAYIYNEAFSNNTTLQDITIPASVKEIMQSAFYKCTNLATVTFAANSNLTIIGYGAFHYCTSLEEIILPNKLKTIDRCAFEGCSKLSSVGLPYSLELIQGSAFRECIALREIYLPDSLIEIGYQAFDSTEITSFTFYEGLEIIETDAIGTTKSLGVKFVYLPSTLTQIPILADYSYMSHNQMIVYCNFEQDKFNFNQNYLNKFYHKFGYTLEEALQDYQSIQDEIAVFAEQGFELQMYRGQYNLIDYTGADTKVVVPDKIARIDKRAFYQNTTVQEVVLPEGITYIGEYAFYGCKNLKAINLPDTLKTIGKYAFAYSGITEIEIPNLVTTISERTFYSCYYLTTASLSESLTTVGDYAFSGTSLTELVLPETVTKLGSYCFQGNDFTTVVIPNSVVTMFVGAFKGCANLQSVTISTGLTSIATEVFSGCSSLEEIIIPNNIASIGIKAFYNCKALTTVDFGSLVATIGESAFSGCTSITQITLPSSVTSLGKNAFAGCSSLEKVFLPKECVTITTEYYSSSPFFLCVETLTIYTDATEPLETWGEYWNAITEDVYATIVYNSNEIPTTEVDGEETGESGEEQTGEEESGTELGDETEQVIE